MEYAGQRVLFEDRLLAHLQVVILDKLRRNEPFFMSWLGSLAEAGRAGMWVHPAHSARFDFVGSRMPASTVTSCRLFGSPPTARAA